MTKNSFLIGAVGDVFIDRPDNALDLFAPVRGIFGEIDLLIGNCEGAFSSRPAYAPSSTWRVVSDPRNAEPLGPAGFHVMSCANNHTMDAGYVGLADTLEALQGQGILTPGAGQNLEEANRPVTLERQGCRVAVTSHASVFQSGYGARPQMPGIATMRVHSHYYFPEWDESGRIEPGARPHVRTFAWPEDIASLGETLAGARAQSDVVVASFHWGSAWKRGMITDYEREIARAAIDAGADLVLGHHHHFLRGIEFYKGKPIFYGLGHFVFDLAWIGKMLPAAEIERLKDAYGDYAIYPREGYPLLPFHPDGRLTMIALAAVEDGRIGEVGFVPCIIGPDNRASPVSLDSEGGRMVLDYVRLVTREGGHPTEYRPSGRTIGGYGIISAHQCA
ncbi:CapA family protein [Bosea sp. (in: a-proteobacteria)]|uniref:CapA family protein n=1 Tax=Bosea sp. (in: a-proteobacteria) TaxID=1871050 RepID=UPI0026197E11|nr:CapA family protein [Bosea sp. (in: a-proteobacteria)]MCO5090585.1 CapA family protein [Bosea sp. (in: a-proteobacteria)]